MSYADTFAAHLRIVLLRCLVPAPEYQLNSSILHDLALEFLAHTRDQLGQQVAWLAEQGLVRLELLNADLARVTLTQRGLDVAEGRARVPGVKRPGPD